MDIDFFISALIFGGLAAFRYWFKRKTLKRQFNYLHRAFCSIAGIGMLTAFSAIAFVVSSEGRPLVESSSPTAFCLLAGFFTLIYRAKSTISSLAEDVA